MPDRALVVAVNPGYESSLKARGVSIGWEEGGCCKRKLARGGIEEAEKRTWFLFEATQRG